MRTQRTVALSVPSCNGRWYSDLARERPYPCRVIDDEITTFYRRKDERLPSAGLLPKMDMIKRYESGRSSCSATRF